LCGKSGNWEKKKKQIGHVCINTGQAGAKSNPNHNSNPSHATKQHAVNQLIS